MSVDEEQEMLKQIKRITQKKKHRRLNIQYIYSFLIITIRYIFHLKMLTCHFNGRNFHIPKIKKESVEKYLIRAKSMC